MEIIQRKEVLAHCFMAEKAEQLGLVWAYICEFYMCEAYMRTSHHILGCLQLSSEAATSLYLLALPHAHKFYNFPK